MGCCPTHKAKYTASFCTCAGTSIYQQTTAIRSRIHYSITNVSTPWRRALVESCAYSSHHHTERPPASTAKHCCNRRPTRRPEHTIGMHRRQCCSVAPCTRCSPHSSCGTPGRRRSRLGISSWDIPRRSRGRHVHFDNCHTDQQPTNNSIINRIAECIL